MNEHEQSDDAGQNTCNTDGHVLLERWTYFALTTEAVKTVARRALSTESGYVDVLIAASFGAVGTCFWIRTLQVAVGTLREIVSAVVQNLSLECWIWSAKTGTGKRAPSKFLQVVGALLPTKLRFDLCRCDGTETKGAERAALAVAECGVKVLVVLAVGGFDVAAI